MRDVQIEPEEACKPESGDQLTGRPGNHYLDLPNGELFSGQADLVEAPGRAMAKLNVRLGA